MLLPNLMMHITYIFIGACLLTMGALKTMTAYPQQVVQISFFFAPICFGFVTLVALASGDDISIMFATFTLALSFLSICFYNCFKKHMAFAASNLHAALSCIRLNNGLYILSLGTALLRWVWGMVFWKWSEG